MNRYKSVGKSMKKITTILLLVSFVGITQAMQKEKASLKEAPKLAKEQKAFLKKRMMLLQAASKSGDVNLLKKLFDSDEDSDGLVSFLNSVRINGRGFLIDSCIKGRKEFVRVLLEKDINPNVQNENGATALMAACDSDHIEIVKLLLDTDKVDPNLVDNRGCTALHCAILSEKRVELVKLLLDHNKIDPNLKTPIGGTALILACEAGFVEVVKLLLDNDKVDPNLGTNDGTTPLMYACEHGHVEVVKLLLGHEKIDPYLKADDGATALDIAKRENNKVIIEKIMGCKICSVCYEPAYERCGGCRAVSYCGTACQKKDWKNHRKICKKKVHHKKNVE